MSSERVGEQPYSSDTSGGRNARDELHNSREVIKESRFLRRILDIDTIVIKQRVKLFMFFLSHFFLSAFAVEEYL
jgi:hypothetical protein